MRTLGVEEEFLLVDHKTGQALPLAAQILSRQPAAQQGADLPYRITGELQLEQIEASTVPCEALADLVQALRAGRAAVDDAAQRLEARAAALATSPLPVSPHMYASPRYAQVLLLHGIAVREQLIGGMHVHVEVATAQEGVAVLDRIRVWLPLLLALSANSPFWQGQDTGYWSFRSRVWNRWPTSGPAPLFGSADAYHRHVQQLLATGAILDPDMVYLDARLSSHYPTVEIRAMDVCLEVHTAELLAGLVRALVEASVRDWRAGLAPPALSTSMLRVAMWRAARFGTGAELLDPVTCLPVPAKLLGQAALQHIAGVLGTSRDKAQLRRLMELRFQQGSGAERQRRSLAHGGHLPEVVRDAVLATHAIPG
ncbi:glutamate--cysteine ligase [Specibacter sp. NPDC057265]|uniref:carboxylate-amine ligase n=1 Tax=Specibacter sp. NPDC057265 TaxID=3346075 RepID=UPI003626DABF